jgi:hypothetical protein
MRIARTIIMEGVDAILRMPSGCFEQAPKIRKGTTPEPTHREIYSTLQIPAEVMKPVKTWHEPTT